jgi:glycosyltransferase involved in cell wall biosynthesis
MTIVIISMIRDSWGGSEELWHDMARIALDRQYNVIHFRYDHPTIHPKHIELVKKGLVLKNRPGWINPTVGSFRRILRLGINYIRKKAVPLDRQIDLLNPDVILYNGTCYSIGSEKSLLTYLEQHTDIPFYIVGHLNNSLDRSMSEPEAEKVRWSYHRAKKVFFVSEKSLTIATRQLCMDISNAQIIKNPVNLNSVDEIPFSDFSDVLNLACVGNLITQHKGQDLLLEALSILNIENWHLNIYGNGPDRDYLYKLTSFLNLESKVTFHGNVSDIRDIWNYNQVLLMPSIMEGMPLAVVEAMLCGRICIATDVGGISEWIKHGESGYLIPAPTVDFISRGIEEAIKDQSNWPVIAKHAHQVAIDNYDPEAGVTLLNSIIKHD